MIRRDREIRHQLKQYAGTDTTLRVGISILQKARLLFDLWVLFSDRNKDVDIRLVNVQSLEEALGTCDILEGAFWGYAWQKDKDFLKVCDVQLGIGMPNGHPLWSKKELSVGDFKGMTVLMPDHTLSSELNSLYEQLKLGQVLVREIEAITMGVMWECSCNQYLLVAPMCMQDVFSELTMRHCKWNYTIPYGFITERGKTPALQEFLDFTKGVYDGSVDAGIVPILD